MRRLHHLNQLGVLVAFRSFSYSEIAESLTLLEADLSTSEKDLKKKYRELVRKHHPDAGGNEALMAKITVAYDKISSLSKKDRDEMLQQQKAYRGGSGSFGRSFAQASRAYAGSPNKEQRQNREWQQGPDFARAYAARSTKTAHNFNQGFHSHNSNPFDRSSFDLRGTTRSFSTMPFGHIVLRAMVAYFSLSIVLLFLYRRYSDWRHDDGWKASDALARHEQMEHIHRLRQELNEKISMSQGLFRNEKAKLERVAEFSHRRSMELHDAEIQCWPVFESAKGTLIKKSHDPAGITYFEPGSANEKARQLSSAFGESLSERNRTAENLQIQVNDEKAVSETIQQLFRGTSVA